MKHCRPCLASFLVVGSLGVNAFAANPSLSAAHAALSSGDFAIAIQQHREYLAQNPDALDAAKEALHLAFILDKQKASTADVRAAFQFVEDKYPRSEQAGEAMYRRGLLSLREKDVASAKGIFAQVSSKHPGTAGAAMANFSLTNYFIKDRRYDTAIQQFAAIAANPAAPPALADEALLQTGFLHISKYFALAFMDAEGRTIANSDLEAKLKYLEDGRSALVRAIQVLDRKTGDLGAHQTAAAYAECGIGEINLLEGLPEPAEQWYRAALSRNTELVQPAVRTLATLGLGVSLYRQGRYVAADEAFQTVLARPITGVVLYNLRVEKVVESQAQIWRAAVARHLNDMETAKEALARGLQTLTDDAGPDTSAAWLIAARWRDTLDGSGRPAPPDPLLVRREGGGKDAPSEKTASDSAPIRLVAQKDASGVITEKGGAR